MNKIIIDCCEKCGAYDHDYEQCTIPSYELIYACPLQNEETDKHKPSYINNNGR